MPLPNPFTRKTIPYHLLSKESTEQESEHAETSTSTTNRDSDEQNAYLLAKHLHRPRRSRFKTICSYTFISLLSLLSGLIVSQFFALEYDFDGYLAPYANNPTHNLHNIVWSENTTFAASPNAATEAAWESLIPSGRGFIQHPALAKDTKAIAVFHELHCLHGLRLSYFKTSYALSKMRHQHHQQRQEQDPYTTHPRDDHPHIAGSFTLNPYLESLLAEHNHGHEHITHCFEYLRQALMCAADTNLEGTKMQEFERADGGKGYVLGSDAWGTKRVCRGFEGVKRWAEKWRSGDEGGIV
ncbi:hypothetical protein P3342_002233 [Pyrenophora teres f. teres]|uniref:DUF3328 domain containing protein n=1 Tax=Pyrenophora teres f. teres (strain 0-1) TaxID=861557 RepID=E3RG51_PYRTT|nr:hypothetical protein PTT_06749 [Pyrenophora teres f. teres 0-1]KAK1919939.1 hypothetical protein P3342_002233 [Pyrenophora teres f. teres]